MNTAIQYPATLSELQPHFTYSNTHALIGMTGGALYHLAGGHARQLETIAERMRATYGDAAGFMVRAVVEWQALPMRGGMAAFLDALQCEFVEVQIPFMGFYESHHSAALDDAFHQMFGDSSGGQYSEKLAYGIAFYDTDFAAAYRSYARDYAETFATEYGLDSLQFVTMESPREYNFETDRIFVRITRQEAARMARDTDSEILTRIATERHSSRSGFISFYDADATEWGDISEWDHNQLATLLLAHVETQTGDEWDSETEWGLMEDASGNGYLDSWLCDAMGAKAMRALNIASYLRQREERGCEGAAEAFDSFR